MNSLDLRSIGKLSTITNMDAILCNINIFYKKRECFSDAHSRLKQETYQEPITRINTGVEQLLNLVFRDCFGALSFLFLLPEHVFGDGRPLRDVMKKPFVPSETPWQRGGSLLFHIGRDLIHPQLILVKASDHCQRMIDGPNGAGLFRRMGRENLERTRRQFEPQNKSGEIIESHVLPVEVLLRQEFPIQPERSRIRA